MVVESWTFPLGDVIQRPENMPEEIYLINRDNVEIPVLWDHY